MYFMYGGVYVLWKGDAKTLNIILFVSKVYNL